MIGFDEAMRLARMQERLRAATYHELQKDGHHKSSEGAVTLSFVLPPVVGDDRDPYWTVDVYSYLLCPHARHENWNGRTAGEAIGKAEDAVSKWCFAAEMEQFNRLYGPDPDPEFDGYHPAPADLMDGQGPL